MHAAVIEFNTLPDAVRSATQHHDFFVIGRLRFTLLFISGIHIGRFRGKLCSAGVNPFIDWVNAESMTRFTHDFIRGAQQFCETAVCKAFLFQTIQRVFVEVGNGDFVEPQFNVHNVFDLRQKPRVDTGQRMDFVQAEPLGKRVADVPDTFRAGFSEFFFNGFPVPGFFIQSVNADFQTAQRFLKRFLKGPANRHDFADRFHLSGQMMVSLREFFKSETRYFGHNVINGRLKRGWSGAAGDIVA